MGTYLTYFGISKDSSNWTKKKALIIKKKVVNKSLLKLKPSVYKNKKPCHKCENASQTGRGF